MTQQDFWNEKFSKVHYLYGTEPNDYIKHSLQDLSHLKKALCLGEGEGRNAIFLASRGFDVDAIDASDIGLSKLQARAKEFDLAVSTFHLDLTTWQPTKKYDLIVASYLHMPTSTRQELFKKIENSLNINGYFIMEVFSKAQLNYSSGGPKDEDLLYSLGEFKTYFKNINFIEIEEKIVTLNEGIGHLGIASVIRILMKRI